MNDPGDETAREAPTGWAVLPLDPEDDEVVGWRRHILVDAGYPLRLAERVARRHRDVDLHQAVELVRKGCEPELAAKILL